MQMNVTFESIEELMGFCRMLAGTEVHTSRAGTSEEAGGGVQAALPLAAVPQPVQQAAPVPATAAPVTAPAPAAAPQPVQQAVPISAVPVTAPQAPVAVPTTAPGYTLDDLARAAMTLMDVGRQGELQQLLAQFGVEALPMLPKEQYGAFATALRGMGARI